MSPHSGNSQPDPDFGTRLRMRNVGMVFSDVRVLDAVNLDVRAGEVHVLRDTLLE